MTLTLLQLTLKFGGLAYIPAFTKLYQRTLDWFPGFVFMLASILTVVGMIPVRCVLLHLYLCSATGSFCSCVFVMIFLFLKLTLNPPSPHHSLIGCRLPEEDGCCRTERGHSLTTELPAVWETQEVSHEVRK